MSLSTLFVGRKFLSSQVAKSLVCTPVRITTSTVWGSSGINAATSTASRHYGSTKVFKLKKEADEALSDATKQAALLKALNNENRERDVIARFERGNIGVNEEVTYEYLVALSRMNKITPTKLAELMAKNTPQATSEVNAVSIPNRISLDSSVPLKIEMNTKPSMFTLWRYIVLGFLLYFLFFNNSSLDPTKSLGMNSAPSKVTKKTNVKFSDVKGVDDAKEQLVNIIEYLKYPQKFSALGGKLPKGVLLTGPPGTGKTLLAKAVAGEANVPFFYAAGSEFDEVFVGLGARRIRNLFSEAKKNAPCIIFIDEIETVGASRKQTINSSGRDNTINQLLTELDGFVENSGVIVIAATNFPESLDAALTRPGRFDKMVTVSLPDYKGRKDIIELYLKNIVHTKDVNTEILARATLGMSGAELFNMINVSALNAAKANVPAVDMRLLQNALDEVVMGVENKSKFYDPENRKHTAYHEAGHALVSLFTEGSREIHKATLLPRGDALGMVAYLGHKDETKMTKKQLFAKVATAMGGRAAEEIIYGTDGISAGAMGDFKSAYSIVKAMVTEFGMGDNTGVRVIKDKDRKEISEATLKNIDAEIDRIISKQMQYAKDLLKSKERELHLLAGALLERETLTGEEIKLLLDGKLEAKSNLNKL